MLLSYTPVGAAEGAGGAGAVDGAGGGAAGAGGAGGRVDGFLGFDIVSKQATNPDKLNKAEKEKVKAMELVE